MCQPVPDVEVIWTATHCTGTEPVWDDDPPMVQPVAVTDVADKEMPRLPTPNVAVTTGVA